MNRKQTKWKWALGLPLALTIGIAGVALAQGTVTLTRQVLSAGGASVSSGNVVVASTIGQPFAGSSAASGVAVNYGFWIPVGPSTIYLPAVLRNYSEYAVPCGPANNYCEPNNGFSQAYGPLAPGVSYQAYPGDPEDFYYVTLHTTASIVVQVTNYQADGWLELFDQTHKLLKQEEIHGGKTISVSSQAPGTYYIRIYTYQLNPNVLYTLIVNY